MTVIEAWTPGTRRPSERQGPDDLRPWHPRALGRLFRRYGPVLAPLNGAVVASGTFVATGQNKLVQHLEGGIIRDLAGEGGRSRRAEPGAGAMDDTAAKAKLRRLMLRKYRLLTMQARLEAEMRGADTFEVPPALAASARDPEVRRSSIVSALSCRPAGPASTPRRACSGRRSRGWRKAFAATRRRLKSTQQRMALFAEELKDKASAVRAPARAQDRSPGACSAPRRAWRASSASSWRGSPMPKSASPAPSSASPTAFRGHSEGGRGAAPDRNRARRRLGADPRRAGRRRARRGSRAGCRASSSRCTSIRPAASSAPGAVIMELLPVKEELLIEAQVNPRDISHVRERQAGAGAAVRRSTSASRR